MSPRIHSALGNHNEARSNPAFQIQISLASNQSHVPLSPNTERTKTSFTRKKIIRGNSVSSKRAIQGKSGFKRKAIEVKGQMISPKSSPRRLLQSILTKTERTLQSVARRDQSRKQAKILSARGFQNIGRSGWEKETIFEPKCQRAPLDRLEIQEMAKTCRSSAQNLKQQRKLAWGQIEQRKQRGANQEDRIYLRGHQGEGIQAKYKAERIKSDKEEIIEEFRQQSKLRLIREDTGGTQGLLHLENNFIIDIIDNSSIDGGNMVCPHLESQIALDSQFRTIEGESFMRGQSPIAREIADLFEVYPSQSPPLQIQSILDDPIIRGQQESSSKQMTMANRSDQTQDEKQYSLSERKFRARKAKKGEIQRVFQNQEQSGLQGTKSFLIQTRDCVKEIETKKYEAIPLIEHALLSREFKFQEVEPCFEIEKCDIDFCFNPIEPQSFGKLSIQTFNGSLSTIGPELKKRKSKHKSNWVPPLPCSSRAKQKSIRHLLKGGNPLLSQSTLKNESQFNLDSFKRRPSIAPFSNSNFPKQPVLQNRKSSKYTPSNCPKEIIEDSEPECDSPFQAHLLIQNEFPERQLVRCYAFQEQELQMRLENMAVDHLRRLEEYEETSKENLQFLKDYLRPQKGSLKLELPLFKEALYCPIELNILAPLLYYDELQHLIEYIQKEEFGDILQTFILSKLVQRSKEHFDNVSLKTINDDDRVAFYDLKGGFSSQKSKRSSSITTSSIVTSQFSSEDQEEETQLNFFNGRIRTEEERQNRFFVYFTIQEHLPQILNEKRISQIFASWFNSTNSDNPDNRCNISLHTPQLRAQFFACLAMVEHSLSLQEMLKSPRRLSTDRLVRKGRRSLQPCSIQRAALERAVTNVMLQEPLSPRAPCPVPELQLNKRQSGHDLNKWVSTTKKMRNSHSIERKETPTDEVFMLTVQSIQKTVSVRRGDFQRQRFQRFKAHHFISPKLFHFIQTIVPIRLLKEYSHSSTISDSMLDPSLLSAMSASFKESPSACSASKLYSSRPTAPRIQISHTDTSQLDSSGGQITMSEVKKEKKRRGSRLPSASSFGSKLLVENEEEESISLDSFSSTSSQFQDPPKPEDSPRSPYTKARERSEKEMAISPAKSAQESELIDFTQKSLLQESRNKMARLSVPSFRTGFSEGDHQNKLSNISELDQIEMEKAKHRIRLPSLGEMDVPKLLPSKVNRTRTNKSLEIDKRGCNQLEQKMMFKKFERRKTGFNQQVRTLKKKQTWFESSRQRRPSLDFSSSERVFDAAKKGDLLPLKALLKQYVGFQINQRNTEGLALLHIAVQQGDQDMVTFLLRKGAKVNIRDVDGNTPMHYAVSYEHHALINVLIDSGASQRECNLVGKTPWEGL